MTTTQLTTTEQSRLSDLESTIERGQKTFVDVGRALAEVRDAQLYRHEHKTFEDYCRQRWGFTRQKANYLMAGAEVAENVNRGCHSIPSERQARPLTKLKNPDDQREAWEKAQGIAEKEGKPVVARHVEVAVSSVIRKEDLTAKDQSGLRSSEWDDSARRAAEQAGSESANLWQLKSIWKRASKKDRRAFLDWVETRALA